ncbi:MAG: pentapeptide repeat-containing protein [bacterium]
MEYALEISFYALGAVFVLGLLMVMVLLRDVLFRGRPLLLPQAKRVPTAALDAARGLMSRLKTAYAVANGEVRETLSYEIGHFQHRIEALEDKTFSDQGPYMNALKARERLWLEWRTHHEEARLGGRSRAASLRPRMEEIRLHFRVLDKEVEDEYQRSVIRDSLVLKELQESGILTPDVLFPDQAKNGKEETPPPEEADAGESATPGGEGQNEAGEKDAGEGDAGEAGDVGKTPEKTAEHPAAPAKKTSKWAKPLPPYPPAASGEFRQADIPRPEVSKSERTYMDPAMSLEGVPGGVMERADFSLSSLAEVELVGIHRYRDCAFIGTDLRRIELGSAGGVHVFQDCNFRGSSLGQSLLREVIFRRCNLSNTHWRAARLDRVKFENCILDGVHWEGVDLSRTMMSEEMLAGADFSQAGRPPHNFNSPAPETGSEDFPPGGEGHTQTSPATGPGTDPAAQTGYSSDQKTPGDPSAPGPEPDGNVVQGAVQGEPPAVSPEATGPFPGEAPPAEDVALPGVEDPAPDADVPLPLKPPDLEE